MASYVLFMKDEREFYNKLKERDPDMIYKMVKNIIHAVKYKKPKLDLFEVIFKNKETLIFTIEKNQYLETMKTCLEDMIIAERYEICAEIRDILDKKDRNCQNKIIHS